MSDCVVMINASGGVHSVPKGLYESEYKRRHGFRILKDVELKKFGELSDKLAEATDARFNAVDADGKPDLAARSKASGEVAKARTALEKYIRSLVE